MPALDPRLLRHARPARMLLGLDTALGLATAVLVLVQASLLAWIVARAFRGASLGDGRSRTQSPITSWPSRTIVISPGGSSSTGPTMISPTI